MNQPLYIFENKNKTTNKRRIASRSLKLGKKKSKFNVLFLLDFPKLYTAPLLEITFKCRNGLFKKGDNNYTCGD